MGKDRSISSGVGTRGSFTELGKKEDAITQVVCTLHDAGLVTTVIFALLMRVAG
jgi:hypothetical protein